MSVSAAGDEVVGFGVVGELGSGSCASLASPSWVVDWSFSRALLFATHWSIGVPTWTYYHGDRLAIIRANLFSDNVEQETYHTTCRVRCLRLTPQLIPPTLDIVHAIEDHDVVSREHPLRARIGNSASFFLCARMVVYRPWMRAIVRRDNMDFISGLQRDRRIRFGGCEKLILCLFDERR